jgi:hypothetical protein
VKVRAVAVADGNGSTSVIYSRVKRRCDDYQRRASRLDIGVVLVLE